MNIKAKSVLEQKQTENHQMFSDVFCKHCMQKQIIKNKMWISTRTITAQNKPKWSSHKPSSSMHHPLQVFPGNKPPNARPTDPHDNDPTPNQPFHGGSNKCLDCCCCCFLFGYPEGSSLTCGPRVRRRWCCGSGTRPWLTGPSAL